LYLKVFSCSVSVKVANRIVHGDWRGVSSACQEGSFRDILPVVSTKYRSVMHMEDDLRRVISKLNVGILVMFREDTTWVPLIQLRSVLYMKCIENYVYENM
jgi:hypothetical protein